MKPELRPERSQLLRDNISLLFAWYKKQWIDNVFHNATVMHLKLERLGQEFFGDNLKLIDWHTYISTGWYVRYQTGEYVMDVTASKLYIEVWKPLNNDF